jgi:hypothetical protein
VLPNRRSRYGGPPAGRSPDDRFRTRCWNWCPNATDPDATEAEQEAEAAKLGAEVKVTGEYDDNPTGR